MSWMIYVAKAMAKSGKAASKVGGAASKAGGAASKAASASGLAKAFNGIKLGSWLKAGTAGGIGIVIYSWWNSLVSSFAGATGLSTENSGTVLSLAFGLLVIYIVVSILVPKNGSVHYHGFGYSRSSGYRDSGRRSGRRSGYRYRRYRR